MDFVSAKIIRKNTFWEYVIQQNVGVNMKRIEYKSTKGFSSNESRLTPLSQNEYISI